MKRLTDQYQKLRAEQEIENSDIKALQDGFKFMWNVQCFEPLFKLPLTIGNNHRFQISYFDTPLRSQ